MSQIIILDKKPFGLISSRYINFWVLDSHGELNVNLEYKGDLIYSAIIGNMTIIDKSKESKFYNKLVNIAISEINYWIDSMNDQ